VDYYWTKTLAVLNNIKMSDFGDDMEVDGEEPQTSIQFSSENTSAKGKRIVADLPIEAEDNLPWYILHGSSETILTQTQGGKVPSGDA
jgi:hypothetical protein